MSSFKWQEFIDLAWHILQNNKLDTTFIQSKEECVWRTLVSRSYYGIFKQIEDFLENNNLVTVYRLHGSHKRIVDFFQNKYPQFYGRFERLKNLRQIADYKKNLRVSKKDAENAARLAQGLTQDLKNKIVPSLLSRSS